MLPKYSCFLFTVRHILAPTPTHTHTSAVQQEADRDSRQVVQPAHRGRGGSANEEGNDDGEGTDSGLEEDRAPGRRTQDRRAGSSGKVQAVQAGRKGRARSSSPQAARGSSPSSSSGDALRSLGDSGSPLPLGDGYRDEDGIRALRRLRQEYVSHGSLPCTCCSWDTGRAAWRGHGCPWVSILRSLLSALQGWGGWLGGVRGLACTNAWWGAYRNRVPSAIRAPPNNTTFRALRAPRTATTATSGTLTRTGPCWRSSPC